MTGGVTLQKYRVVCYMRLDHEDSEPLTYNEALREKEHFEFLEPANIYRIEEIED
ncbi:MAG: hypothetical protein HY788_17620 [Deltaproteobacteria bacterium]|nr:hypothetical protein [Deltaproteobacteria bacterium]